jgi:hypothetical protein
MNHKLSDVEARVKRYWYSDGIVELSIGGMFLLLGVYFGVQGYTGQHSTITTPLQIGLILLMIAGAVGVSRLVNTLKIRLTYPRTGFVEYDLNDPEARRRRFLVTGAALIILIVWTVLFRYQAIREFDSMVLVIGIIAGVVLLPLRGESTGANRFRLLGAISIGLGIGLSLSGVSQEQQLALFFGLFGIANLISGGFVLHGYLNQNPIPENQNEN